MRCAAKEQRSRQPQGNNAFFMQHLGQIAAAANIFQGFFVCFDFNLTAHTMHKDDAGHNKTYRNGRVKVDQNGQQQRSQQGVAVAAGTGQQFVYFIKVEHIPSDEHQNGRKTSQRNIFCSRRQQQHKQQ